MSKGDWKTLHKTDKENISVITTKENHLSRLKDSM